MNERLFDRADVVVVGGGTLGVTAAYFLKQRQLDVVLVEQRHVAYGASGRNVGGLWLTGRPLGISLNLCRHGSALYNEFDDVLGPCFGHRKNGGMAYFYTDEQRQVFKEFVELRRADGLDIELLDGKAAREAAPILSDEVLGATFCREDAQTWSPHFVSRLTDHCRRLGVRVYENTAALGLIKKGGRAAGVQTSSGPVEADSVVWATGVWKDVLEEEGVPVPFIPERLGVMVTEPVPPMLDKVLLGPVAMKQYDVLRSAPSFKEEYFVGPWEDPALKAEYLELLVQREDGCLLIGNPEEYPDTLKLRNSMVAAKMMVDGFTSRWPHLRNLTIDRMWAGFLSVTADALPIVGKAPGIDGLVVGGGLVFGNAAGPSIGMLLSELAVDSATTLPVDELKLDRFERIESEGSLVRW